MKIDQNLIKICRSVEQKTINKNKKLKSAIQHASREKYEKCFSLELES